MVVLRGSVAKAMWDSFMIYAERAINENYSAPEKRREEIDSLYRRKAHCIKVLRDHSLSFEERMERARNYKER